MCARTPTCVQTRHQRATAQHLSFGLRLTSEPVSQVVEDIKNRRSEKIKIFPSRAAAAAKAGGLKAPDAFFPTSFPSLFPSHLESPPQVTALFNDAICLMPSRRLSARLALSLVSPVSPHRPAAPPVPGTKEQKEPRPERRCSGLKGALSRLIGWEKTRSSTSTSNRKAGWRWGSAGERREEDIDGHIFYSTFLGGKTFPFC